MRATTTKPRLRHLRIAENLVAPTVGGRDQKGPVDLLPTGRRPPACGSAARPARRYSPTTTGCTSWTIQLFPSGSAKVRNDP